MPFIIILYKIFGQRNNLLQDTTKEVLNFNKSSIQTSFVRLFQMIFYFKFRTFQKLLLN